jgi:SAM-dependent methyltransferase
MSGPGFERSWRQRFERYAKAHDDDAHIAGWSDSGLAARMQCFLRAWRGTPESRAHEGRWLDAGSGAGTYTRFLAGDGRRVVAIDYSLPTVRKAKERSVGSVGWFTADATRLPFREGSFDGALCFGVLQALSSPNDALRELRRVLTAGGVLWLDALNARCVATRWSEARRRRRGLPPHLRYDEPGQLESLLRDSGFGAVEVHWAPIVPGAVRVLQPLLHTSVATATLNAVPPLAAALSHSLLLRARAS